MKQIGAVADDTETSQGSQVEQPCNSPMLVLIDLDQRESRQSRRNATEMRPGIDVGKQRGSSQYRCERGEEGKISPERRRQGSFGGKSSESSDSHKAKIDQGVDFEAHVPRSPPEQCCVGVDAERYERHAYLR